MDENKENTLEEQADQILDEILELSQLEVDRTYSAAPGATDPRRRVLELAQKAELICQDESRDTPPQLKAVFATLKQLELPLEFGPVFPRILLIDDDPHRLSERSKLLQERHINVEFATSALEGLTRAERGTFQLVIVDYSANSSDEHSALLALQGMNLHVPVIMLTAWATLISEDNRRLNRDLLRAVARLLGKKIPRRLPKKRPPTSAAGATEEQSLFDGISPNISSG